MSGVSESINANLCDSCDGLCCRAGTRITLSVDEADYLQRGGTEIRGALLFLLDDADSDDVARAFTTPHHYEVFHEQTRRQVCTDREAFNTTPTLRQVAEIVLGQKPGRQQYVLLSDCGYLDSTVTPPRCSVYEAAERPQVCEGFAPGNPLCIDMRHDAGFTVPVEITPKPQVDIDI